MARSPDFHCHGLSSIPGQEADPASCVVKKKKQQKPRGVEDLSV